jgi:hypothetical protein
LILNEKKQLFSLRDAAMQLRSQRPLHVQGDAGHPSKQGGGPKKNNRKKWRAKEEERHRGSLTQKKTTFGHPEFWTLQVTAHI